MPNNPSFSTNAFNNTNPARGALAESITKSGVVTGIFTGTGPAFAGDRVKLDNTVTTPGFVGFVAAADDEAAFGVIKFNVKQDQFNQGDTVEVVFQGGQAVYQIGSTTLVPGTLVGMSSGFLVQQDGTHAQMGILIDYVLVSTPGRVIIGWVAS